MISVVLEAVASEWTPVEHPTFEYHERPDLGGTRWYAGVTMEK